MVQFGMQIILLFQFMNVIASHIMVTKWMSFLWSKLTKTRKPALKLFFHVLFIVTNCNNIWWKESLISSIFFNSANADISELFAMFQMVSTMGIHGWLAENDSEWDLTWDNQIYSSVSYLNQQSYSSHVSFIE